MQNEPIEVTLLVTRVFEKLDVPYLISGSLASTLYGMVRTTQDSDIVTEMRTEHVKTFVSLLRADFYIDEEMITEAIQRNSSFNIIHRDTMFKVDVFIPKSRPFLNSQMSHTRQQTFNLGTEISALFSGPEDTILSKMEWYRMGGEVSDRQWRDILGVLKTCSGELDLEYLQTWAKELKISDLLDRSLMEVEET